MGGGDEDGDDDTGGGDYGELDERVERGAVERDLSGGDDGQVEDVDGHAERGESVGEGGGARRLLAGWERGIWG